MMTMVPTPTTDVDAEIQAVVAPHLNRQGPWRWSPVDITETSIRDFCAAVEDANPSYWDPVRAKASRFGRLIAPPQSLLAICMKPSWQPAYLNGNGVDTDTATTDPEDEIRGALAELGYGTATAVRRTETYFAPFGPGDGRIRQSVRCTGVSPVKRTKVGLGVFVTSVVEYRVERGDIAVAEAELVILRYAGEGSAS